MAPERIHIERLAFGGSGVGRIGGKVCFVPYSCPGDELLVRITAEKRSYTTASIVDILSPSKHRTEPLCPLFGTCGGCDWQHVAYDCQIEAKRQFLADALWRGARVENDQVRQTVASSLHYGYRSRVQFKLHGRGGKLQIGFFRAGTHFVQDAPAGCPIAIPSINDLLLRFRELLTGFPEPAMLPQINVDCAGAAMVAVVHYIGRNDDAAASFFENAASLGPLTGLYLQTGRKSTLRKVFDRQPLAYELPAAAETFSPCSLSYLPGGFAQVNTLQNRAMLDLVRELAALRGDERLLDLYCGNGNLSLPLSGGVLSITGIEDYPDSIAAAIANVAANNVGNAEYLCHDAAESVSRYADQGRTFEVVLLDPPRSGAADAVALIPRLKPDRIIYVSCDPSTLGRDCGILRGHGYHVHASVPLDMFPQTYHLESVTLLQRD